MARKRKKIFGDFGKLVNEWKVIYAMSEDIDGYADKDGADWESLCVGWCLGKGMSVIEAYSFYKKMIPLRLF